MVNNPWCRDSTKERGQEDKKRPVHDARIPPAVCLNAALMRLPALKVKKKKEKNTGNLSQKEQTSLFAVLTKRQKDTAKEPSSSPGEAFSFFLANGFAV